MTTDTDIALTGELVALIDWNQWEARGRVEGAALVTEWINRWLAEHPVRAGLAPEWFHPQFVPAKLDEIEAGFTNRELVST